jgi:hypothetical protein
MLGTRGLDQRGRDLIAGVSFVGVEGCLVAPDRSSIRPS